MCTLSPDELYEKTIWRVGGIDFLVCGIGLNGHLAFNEPRSPFDSRTRLVELASSTVDAIRSKFSEANYPMQGITMGLATMFEARRILAIASGTSKAAILARALSGDLTPEVPASVLQRHSNATVIADEQAAATYLALSHVQTDRSH